MHNAPEQDFDNPARWDPSRLDRRRRLAAMARMDAIGVLLEEYRAWYPAALQPRIAVIPNAVVPVAPARLAQARRGRVVLAVGRLAAVKRHDVLIAAWGRIAADFPGWELRIFGEGPLRADLEAQVAAAGLQGSVRLMGHTADIAQEYLGAALLAHPAEFEGFPLAVTEALAAGLPVLGFADCSGLNRLVADGVNGRLVAPADGRAARTAAFAAALAGLMADAGARAALSAAAPGSVAAYAPDRVLGLWDDAISGRTGSQAAKGKDDG
jgi:glycosyltransferase involved in cell wall biosynthesis